MFVDMFYCATSIVQGLTSCLVFAADSSKDKVKENFRKHQSELQNLLYSKDYTSICPGTDQFGKL